MAKDASNPIQDFLVEELISHAKSKGFAFLLKQDELLVKLMDHFNLSRSKAIWEMQSELKGKISDSNPLFNLELLLGFLITGSSAEEIYWSLIHSGVPEDVDSGGTGGAVYKLPLTSFRAFRFSDAGKPDRYKIDLKHSDANAFRYIQSMASDISSSNTFNTLSLKYALPIVEKNPPEKETKKSWWERLFMGCESWA